MVPTSRYLLGFVTEFRLARLAGSLGLTFFLLTTKEEPVDGANDAENENDKGLSAKPNSAITRLFGNISVTLAFSGITVQSTGSKQLLLVNHAPNASFKVSTVHVIGSPSFLTVSNVQICFTDIGQLAFLFWGVQAILPGRPSDVIDKSGAPVFLIHIATPGLPALGQKFVAIFGMFRCSPYGMLTSVMIMPHYCGK